MLIDQSVESPLTRLVELLVDLQLVALGAGVDLSQGDRLRANPTDDIDLIVLATSTPDNTFPATAVNIQNRLGMVNGAAFDVQAVCAGFVFALANANALIVSGQSKCVLVIGAETFSRILDMEDRSTCVLFGDGAGALLIEAATGTGENTDRGILSSDLNSDGRYREMLYVDGGVSTTGTAGKLRMQGNPLFRQAVEKLAATADAHGFILVAPDAGIPLGEGFAWNIPGVPTVAGQLPGPQDRDDVDHLSSIADVLVEGGCVDPARIYSTGLSGGGRMTSWLGCVESDRYAAIAPVVGLRAGIAKPDDDSEVDPTTCTPENTMPPNMRCTATVMPA